MGVGERTRTQSKTLFYKDCSLGSVKNLSNNKSLLKPKPNSWQQAKHAHLHSDPHETEKTTLLIVLYSHPETFLPASAVYAIRRYAIRKKLDTTTTTRRGSRPESASTTRTTTTKKKKKDTRNIDVHVFKCIRSHRLAVIPYHNRSFYNFLHDSIERFAMPTCHCALSAKLCRKRFILKSHIAIPDHDSNRRR